MEDPTAPLLEAAGEEGTRRGAGEEPDYASHFTLRTPASTVHFRGSTLRVVDTDQDQIVLQRRGRSEGGSGSDSFGGGDNGGGRVLVRRLSPATHPQKFLRAGYTLIAILFVGFLFVFCLQVLLFLFVALIADAGQTGGRKVDALAVVGTLLSFPVMLHGMASLMAMGSAFVVDTYNGAALFRSTVVEAIYMCVFLVVPILTLAVALMARSQEPWRQTAAAWAIMVCLTFVVWGVAVTYKQVKACFWLVERNWLDGRSKGDDDEEIPSTVWSGDDVDISAASSGSAWPPSWSLREEEPQDERIKREGRRLLKIAMRAVLLTQKGRYSGEKRERFSILAGEDVNSSRGGTPMETKIGLYSRLTALPALSCAFEPLDEPRRMHGTGEAREMMPFLTKNNWSMQKMWCSGDSRHRNVVVARGPSALTPDQIRFSVLCTAVSSVLMALLLLGALVWMEIGWGMFLIVLAICLVCCIVPVFKSGIDMLRMYDDVNEADGRNDADGAGEANLFQVWESFRITQPRPWYCFARIGVEVVFLFLWPLINMLAKRNYPVALVFFLLGSFTFLWRYFDTSAVLSELGSLSDVAGDALSHKELYRLNEVIGRVINNQGRRWWFSTFAVVFLAVLVLFLSANGGADAILPHERAARPKILLPDGFHYPAMDDTLAYPSCKLGKGFEFPGGMASDLVDYAFLSAMAYETLDYNSYTLPKWFGPGVVIDEEEFVAKYRKDSGTSTNPVYFKLFSVPSAPGYAIMSIRGSETAFDWIHDMQLWSGAGFAQVVKWLTPFGWIFDPILPDLVKLVNMVESATIADVAYYKVTTQFVNDVLGGYGGGNFTNLHVTGVSLGGGLAIITGAQTDAYAVSISGMGATLSRKAFHPPVELEKLNAQTFNFIPERDYVAFIGGRAPFFQNGQCIAPKNDLFGCHSTWRSICEISYRCGSASRPVPCKCLDYGYPAPMQNGTRSFELACQEEEATWDEMFPPN